MEIRYAGSEDDWADIGRIYQKSWQWAYRGLLPQPYLDALSPERWGDGAKHPNLHTLVCAEEGRLVGVSAFCPSRFPAYAGWGEIVSLYLLPEAAGRGLGRALLAAASAGLREMGYADQFLWVLEGNARAIRFYERAGFVPSGDVLPDTIGGKPVRELRCIRRGHSQRT